MCFSLFLSGNFGKDAFHFNETVTSALRAGTLNLSTLDTALRRSLITRMEAGAFDPIEQQMYTKIGPDAVNSTEHFAANLDAASQGLVLLRNNAPSTLRRSLSSSGSGAAAGAAGSTLPLAQGKRLAVVGPHAVSTRGLFSDYYGDQICYDPSSWASRNFSCVPTIGQMLTHYK